MTAITAQILTSIESLLTDAFPTYSIRIGQFATAPGGMPTIAIMPGGGSTDRAGGTLRTRQYVADVDLTCWMQVSSEVQRTVVLEIIAQLDEIVRALEDADTGATLLTPLVPAVYMGDLVGWNPIAFEERPTGGKLAKFETSFRYVWSNPTGV